MKKLKVYIIEQNIGGVSYEPKAFSNPRKANRYYIKLINEVHSKSFKSVKDAVNYMKENNGADDHDILYWTIDMD